MSQKHFRFKFGKKHFTHTQCPCLHVIPQNQEMKWLAYQDMASYSLPITGSGNGLAPTWHQAITQTIADLLSNALKT